MEKQHIDIGVRKQPAPPKTADRHECEILRPTLVRSNKFFPQAPDNFFDQCRPLGHRSSPVPGSIELLLNADGLFAIEVP